MDKKGEIDRLTKIIKPDVGIITNISYAHAKNFKNINQIALAKAEIINNIKPGGLIILNADDSFFSLHKKIALKKNLQVLTFGMYKKANVQFRSISRNKNNFKISVVINNKKTFFNLSSNFENFIKNILAVITVISYFADPFKLDKNIFRNFQTPEGRGDILKIKINKKNINLVDESYNSNPLSLKSAIQNFNMIKTRNKKYMILGDMMELGRHSKIQHRKIAPIINSSGIDKINILGNHIKETFKNIKPVKKGLILSESLQIIDLIKNQLNNNDYLMIKGSNSTGLNKFTKELKKMLYSLSLNFVEVFTFLNVFKYLTVRTGLAVFTSMFVVFIVGTPFIKFFSTKQILDPIREDGPSEHIIKKIGTPTMGGVLILLGLFSGILLWGDLSNFLYGF